MKLTVFTPTFNRKDKLSRLYESLINQTHFDFEWLIIDDGSTDNTEELTKKFNTSNFEIKYIKKQNGGKHRAYNDALKLASGEYFFCVDSDDWLENNAVENIINALSKMQDANYIVAYKKDQTGKLLSSEFPKDLEKVNFFELYQKYSCSGEFSLIFKTLFARKFPFPTFEGENFVTESVIYDRISQSTDAFLLPQVLTICEYQEDGLSNNINDVMKKNPAGYCLYFMQQIDLSKNIIIRVSMAGKYCCFKILAKKNRTIYTGKYNLFVSLCGPIGILFLLYYKLFRGF